MYLVFKSEFSYNRSFRDVCGEKTRTVIFGGMVVDMILEEILLFLAYFYYYSIVLTILEDGQLNDEMQPRTDLDPKEHNPRTHCHRRRYLR